MTLPTHDATAHLRALLADGARNSREVLRAMGVGGFSAKQTRTARERLGVVAARAGSGSAMHSTWRLPQDGQQVTGEPSDPGDELTETERHRRLARIRAFVLHGIPAVDAETAAGLLAQADRQNRPAFGSCAQCQTWHRRECMDSKPATEIHVCWRRRLGTP